MAGQLWSVNSLGGFLSSNKLSKYLRESVQPELKFRQFCDVQDASMSGKGKGATFTYDVVSDVATQGTTLTETTIMPETNFTITQGTVTMTEYGNSVPFTMKLDNLSEMPVKKIIRKALKNDAAKAFDTAAHAQFNSTVLTVTASSGTDTSAITLETTGTPTATNNVAFSLNHAKNICDTMKERNIPAFKGGDYYAIGRPASFRTLKNNLEAIRQYSDPGFGQLMNGEIGRYEGVRYVEQSGIASEAWTNGKSDAIFFFGEDTVAEAIAVPEEVRGKIPTDYGRSMGVAWYYLGGFGLIHDGTASPAAQARVVKWDSAA